MTSVTFAQLNAHPFGDGLVRAGSAPGSSPSSVIAVTGISRTSPTVT